MNKLIEWVNIEAEKRGWGNNEIARRAGLSSGGVSLVLNGDRSVTFDFCQAMALAFGEPIEKLCRLAGLLPTADDPIGQEVAEYLRYMTPAQRRELLNFARYMAQHPED